MASSTVRGGGWFRVYAPRPEATLRLVCFPYAGGGASVFRDWADLLPPSIELVAVQYPGRQDRYGEAFVPDMATLADAIASAVTTHLDRPMAFFGHSLGATIAFEVALRLRPRFPAPVVRLFASARKAPSDCRPGGWTVLGDEAMRSYVQGLRGAGAPALDDGLWQMTAPVLRNDLCLSEHYRYRRGSRLACPVTAIVGALDETITAADAQVWADHTIGQFDVQVLPGGHFFLEELPGRLTALLAERLCERAEA